MTFCGRFESRKRHKWCLNKLWLHVVFRISIFRIDRYFQGWIHRMNCSVLQYNFPHFFIVLYHFAYKMVWKLNVDGIHWVLTICFHKQRFWSLLILLWLISQNCCWTSILPGNFFIFSIVVLLELPRVKKLPEKYLRVKIIHFWTTHCQIQVNKRNNLLLSKDTIDLSRKKVFEK